MATLAMGLALAAGAPLAGIDVALNAHALPELVLASGLLPTPRDNVAAVWDGTYA